MFAFRQYSRVVNRAAIHSRAFSGAARPFQILGLQQIAVGSLDKEGLTQLWQGVFGLEKVGSFKSESENVDEDILMLGKSPAAIEVDLMTPLDENKSPKVHSPALNHIGLWVDDLDTAVDWMKEQGVLLLCCCLSSQSEFVSPSSASFVNAIGVRFTPGGIRKGASGHNVTFIHPKGNEASPIGGAGVLIELVQAPPEVVQALKK